MTRKLLIKRLTLAVFLLASCNFAWEFYSYVIEYIETERMYIDNGWTYCTLGPPRDQLARFQIEMFLILALIANRLDRLPRTLVNVTGLTGAVVSYILWWQYIFRVARSAETTIAAIPNFAYLVRGNVLDLVIAGSIGLLVLLNVREAAFAFVRIEGDDQ